MTAKFLSPVDLHRIDPARNMRRFYMLAIQPTLFGEVSVIRNWGRIGSHGQTKIESYDDLTGAETALIRLAERKRKRGYVDSCGGKANSA